MDKYEYQYDSAGNQTSKTEKIDGTVKGTTTYTYDDLNRLESVTEPDDRCTEYTYDKSGNRAMKTVTEEVYSVTEVVYSVYEYDSCNLLESITEYDDKDKEEEDILGITVYTYDDNGNTTKEEWTEYIDGEAQTTQVTVYEYDWLNRQTSAEADGVEVISVYNGEGLRVEKQVGGNTSRYLYEYSKVVLELDGEGEVSAKNTYGLNLISREIDSDKYYYLYNGNADVTGLITVTGEVYGTYYYDAFGNIIDETGGADNPFRYKGYKYDEETGLYYLNSRMYDPVTARFLQEDTYSGNLEDPLSLNFYTYAVNNPLSYYDPSGFMSAKVSFDGRVKEFDDIIQKDGFTYVGLRDFAKKMEFEENLYWDSHTKSAWLYTYHSNEYGIFPPESEGDILLRHIIMSITHQNKIVFPTEGIGVYERHYVNFYDTYGFSIALDLKYFMGYMMTQYEENGILYYKTYVDIHDIVKYICGDNEMDVSIEVSYQDTGNLNTFKDVIINGTQYYDFSDQIMSMFNRNAEICKAIMNNDEVMREIYYKQGIIQGIYSEIPSRILEPIVTLLTFKNLVDNDGPWDIKRQRQWGEQLPELSSFDVIDKNAPRGFRQFVFNGKITTAEDLGNIAYGYWGSVLGCGSELLHWGAGYAQLNFNESQQAKREGRKARSISYFDSRLAQGPYYADDPYDYKMIERGIKLYYTQNPGSSPRAYYNINPAKVFNNIL